jgi:hypothetical protein
MRSGGRRLAFGLTIEGGVSSRDVRALEVSRPQLAVGDGDRDPPMNISPPTHRRVPWDAGSRMDGRRPGEAHPRTSGRKPGISPPRLPAARVNRRVAVLG